MMMPSEEDTPEKCSCYSYCYSFLRYQLKIDMKMHFYSACLNLSCSNVHSIRLYRCNMWYMANVGGTK